MNFIIDYFDKHNCAIPSRQKSKYLLAAFKFTRDDGNGVSLGRAFLTKAITSLIFTWVNDEFKGVSHCSFICGQRTEAMIASLTSSDKLK